MLRELITQDLFATLHMLHKETTHATPRLLVDLLADSPFASVAVREEFREQEMRDTLGKEFRRWRTMESYQMESVEEE